MVYQPVFPPWDVSSFNELLDKLNIRLLVLHKENLDLKLLGRIALNPFLEKESFREFEICLSLFSGLG